MATGYFCTNYSCTVQSYYLVILNNFCSENHRRNLVGDTVNVSLSFCAAGLS